MKTLFLILVTTTFFISCNTKEKYQGRWSNYMQKYSSYNNEIRSVIIKNDSISFTYPYFDYSNKFALKIENRKFNFNNLSIDASIEQDTLSLNDSLYFVKDEKDTIYGAEIKLKIDLPKVPNIKISKRNEDDYTIFLFYGKRIDNGSFSLQLNDKYAEYSDLPSFLHVGCGGRREEIIPFVTNYLFFDKDSKMNELEKIFIEMSRINSQKIKLVNDIHILFNDSLGLYYEYESIVKKIHPYQVNDNYNPNEKIILVPPPPPPYFPIFDNFNLHPNFIFLKKDQIYVNNKAITRENFKKLIKPWIENNEAIFSLYDLESKYGNFLEINAIINNVYEEVRENHSKLKFNKTLNELNRAEYDEIKMKIKMYHIWNYSIPHFNSIIKNNNSFFGLNVPLVDFSTSAE